MRRLDRLPMLLALSVLLSQCGPASMSSEIKVVGGRPAQEYRFMAAIGGEDGEQFCGGSFIREDVVVTAAHCVYQDPQRMWVAFGVRKLSEIHEGNKIDVKAIKIHSDYDPDELHNDVALLFLDPSGLTRVAGKIEPIILQAEDDLPDATMFTTIGWGNATSEGRYNEDHLLEANVPMIGNDVCHDRGGRYESIVDSQICAGYLNEGGTDTCNGDSGGPLFLGQESSHYVLAGIVSWGEGCAEPGQPGVYTRVSSFTSWIHDELNHYDHMGSQSEGKIRTGPTKMPLPDDGLDRSPIGLKLDMDSSISGHLYIKNFLGKKIFGWQLSCNFSYSISTMNNEPLPVNKNGSFYQLGISSADRRNGILPSRSGLAFKFATNDAFDPTDRSKSCTINGYKVGWNDFNPQISVSLGLAGRSPL